jgi:hypothetical protein
MNADERGLDERAGRGTAAEAILVGVGWFGGPSLAFRAPLVVRGRGRRGRRPCGPETLA